MFMDSATNQTNNQNTNLANTISIGSTDSGNGGFSPTNDNTNEFKASNDLGASVGVGVGGSAQAGAVGMSRGEERAQEETFDGYTQAPQSDTKKIITYVLIAVVVVVLSVLGGSFIKRKKR